MFRKSYAKINLFLDVVKRRDDGYHEIKTVFTEIDLHDELNFALTKNGSINILTNTDKIELEKNLIYQVAFFIKRKYDVSDGCRIELKKNIPIAAGLGGGSSNAAATIEALSNLWNLNLSLSAKNEIASAFGSDIAFFLQGGTAIGEGKGEKLTPISHFDIENIVLVNPGFAVSSKLAYSLVSDIQFDRKRWEQFVSHLDVRFAFNRLEQPVAQSFPEVHKIIDEVRDMGAAQSILSGSGATVIGFCENKQIAQNISKFYSKKQYWNCITKTKRRSL